MLVDFPAPVIGAFVSSFFAFLISLYSLYIARRSRKMDTTRDVLKRYFSVEFTLIRREALPELQRFWEAYRTRTTGANNSLIKYLMSSRLHEYVFSTERGANNLTQEQNTLIFLYFWAELDAYRKRGLLEDDLVKELLVSGWDFYGETLKKLADEFVEAMNREQESRRLRIPAWVHAIRAIDDWIYSNEKAK